MGFSDLGRGLAEAQLEELFLEPGLLLAELLRRQVSQLGVLHHTAPIGFRVTNRVAMGNFMAASRMASFASVSEIPSIS